METKHQNKNIYLEDLGTKDYKEVWEYQELLLENISLQKKENRDSPSPKETVNHFLFVEHPHVITLGRNGQDKHLLISNDEMKKKNIAFYKINRGGDITYHGPGQIVGYPILDLDNFFTDIHKYLRYLEEVIIKTLSDYGLKTSRSKGETGVWIDANTPFARKICAIGIRTSRWVTMHGFALNINTDINYFNYIIPCGITEKKVTSLNKELGLSHIDTNEVKTKILHYFEDVFECVFKKKNLL